MAETHLQSTGKTENAHVWDGLDVVEPPERDNEDNKLLWEARESLALIRDFARSRYVSPLATLGVVLARVITHTPPNLVLPAIVGGQASLNLFVALVGPSGKGKGGAEAVGAALLDVPNPIEPSNIGSGEGIPNLFVTWMKEKGEDGRQRDVLTKIAEAAILSVPEIDTMKALGNRVGSTLMPELRKAYSGENLGFQNATREKRLRVGAHSYRLTLIVGVQPLKAGALLDDADGGTPQRFIWLPTNDPLAPDFPPDEPEQRLSYYVPRLGGLEERDGRHAIKVCESAKAFVIQQRLANLRSDLGTSSLDVHETLTRLKVAAALGLLEGRPEVAESDWRLAELVMDISRKTRLSVEQIRGDQVRQKTIEQGRSEGLRALVVEDTKTRHAKTACATAVKNKLAKLQNGDWLAGSKLRKAIYVAHRAYLDAVLEHLLSVGDIEGAEIEGARAQGGMQYRLMRERGV